MISVDLTKNSKQASFFLKAIEASLGENEYRYFFFGGAIRAGKTYVCLTILVLLCKLFKESKWVVIRKNFATLKETTIPTLNKILGRSNSFKWNRDAANYYVEFPNYSRIFFAGENITQDPELNWMLGYEANGFFLEQIEELSEKLFNFSIQRSGSWILNKMPTPIILATFNPTRKWIFEKVYKKYIDNELLPPYYYQQAVPHDNPFITQEQWDGWKNMDEKSYNRYTQGSWLFEKDANVFAYSFGKKNIDDSIKYDDNLPLYLSFDFNVEPITCLACQHNINYIHIIKEFRLINSDIYKLCERIITSFGSAYFVVTGDATGQARSAISRGNINYYTIIRNELLISSLQIKKMNANPMVKNTRVLLNSLFERHPCFKINSLTCPFLIDDLNNVAVDINGDIDKNKDKHKTHLLDCLRYYVWYFHRQFIDKNLYPSF